MGPGDEGPRPAFEEWARLRLCEFVAVCDPEGREVSLWGDTGDMPYAFDVAWMTDELRSAIGVEGSLTAAESAADVTRPRLPKPPYSGFIHGDSSRQGLAMKPILTLTMNPCIDASSDADTIQPIHKIRTSKESFQAGGGGINAARVINTLGGRSLAVYLSGGTTGGVLNGLVEACEIASRHVTIAEDTRISHTVYERSSGLEFRFVPQGPGVAEAEWRECLRAVEEADFDYVIASGSLPQGVPDDFYVRVGDIASGKGAKLVLDTSGAPLKATLAKGGVYVTKPSHGEFRDYVGRDVSDEANLMAAAVDVVRSGKTEILVVSMGHEGAVMATAEGAIRMVPPAVEAISAVGAGDSFVGAMTFALSRRLMPRRAFEVGMAAGTAAVTTPGTELCRKADVESLLRRIHLERQQQGEAVLRELVVGATATAA